MKTYTLQSEFRIQWSTLYPTFKAFPSLHLCQRMKWCQWPSRLRPLLWLHWCKWLWRLIPSSHISFSSHHRKNYIFSWKTHSVRLLLLLADPQFHWSHLSWLRICLFRLCISCLFGIECKLMWNCITREILRVDELSHWDRLSCFGISTLVSLQNPFRGLIYYI